MTGQILVYGANGFTGRLIVREAVRRGLRPILAGRNDVEIRELAQTEQLPHRVFALDAHAEVVAALQGVTTVLHCAGPFASTAPPMVRACLDARVHYVDIAGEVPVLQHLFSLKAEARARGIVILPGSGFDVVPTDCLALALKERLPSATRLRLAFQAPLRQSPGTFKATVNAIPNGGAARIDGILARVPHAWKAERIAFDNGKWWCMSMPWGDLVSAWESTGIPNIEVYINNALATTLLMKLFRRPAMWLAKNGAVRDFLHRHAGQIAPGPDDTERMRITVHLRGDVWDDAGGHDALLLVVPEAYATTARTAVEVAIRVTRGDVPSGAHTPASVFGSGFIEPFARQGGFFRPSQNHD
ncbi:MAG: saccharopine dehydrogenase NADP-binding domain-containing protein [Ignavibacteria bacterium]|nr:saccharopine dehydrogenase NADP-binding domain-containing protein [Ignavibacteria bacterium]